MVSPPGSSGEKYPLLFASGAFYFGEKMLKVYPKPREDIRSTMKRLRRLCEKEGLFKELKQHEYYEKKSDRERRERRQAERRLRQSIVSQQKNKKQAKKSSN